jgi:ActR/RegA family two-component response regulator
MAQDRKFRVLVVEDVVDISDSYKFHLENAGYAVDIVETRKDAVAALKCKYYDIALVDLSLKDDITNKGGFEVLDAIKKLQEGTSAIVASGTGEIADSVASYDRGIKGFIMKGATISSKDILEKIEAALKNYRPPLIGDFSTLTAYLAAPDTTPIWEDPIQVALGCGYDSLHKIIWAALKPYLPVLRKKDGSPSLTVDKTRRSAGGFLWSKAEGCAIWISVRGDGGSFIDPPDDRADHLSSIEGKKVLASVWRVNADRDQFLETIRDRPGK